MKLHLTKKERTEKEIQTIERELKIAENESAYWLKESEHGLKGTNAYVTPDLIRKSERYLRIKEEYDAEILVLKKDLTEAKARWEGLKHI